MAVLFVGLILSHALPGSSAPSCDDVVAAMGEVVNNKAGKKPKNLIFFVTDGMGPGYVTFARDAGVCGDLSFDPHYVGAVKTRSADSLVTDSAAGATALATGFKTNNGVVSEVEEVEKTGEGLLNKLEPVGTVLEGAQLAKKWTGIVTTARVTHATPAAFSSHVVSREDENVIAQEQLKLELNVLMGGGRRHFLPRTTAGSKRDDDVDLIDAAKKKHGFLYAKNAAELKKAVDRIRTGDLPEPEEDEDHHRTFPHLLGLFSESHMPYEIDVHGGVGEAAAAAEEEGHAHVHEEGAKEEGESSEEEPPPPTLTQMMRAALDVLSGGPEGFFLLVEAGRIDHGGHANDAGAIAGEICEFNRAFKAALDYAKAHPDTLVVSTSDHDTGGLSVGCCHIYDLNTTAVNNLKMSAHAASQKIAAYMAGSAAAGQTPEQKEAEIRKILVEDAGAYIVDDDKFAAVKQAAGLGGADTGYESWKLNNAVGEVLSRGAIVGFTSHGHTGADVPLYAFGAGSAVFSGVMDNTEVGRKLSEALGVDNSAGYQAVKKRIEALVAQDAAAEAGAE